MSQRMLGRETLRLEGPIGDDPPLLHPVVVRSRNTLEMPWWFAAGAVAVIAGGLVYQFTKPLPVNPVVTDDLMAQVLRQANDTETVKRDAVQKQSVLEQKITANEQTIKELNERLGAVTKQVAEHHKVVSKTCFFPKQNGGELISPC